MSIGDWFASYFREQPRQEVESVQKQVIQVSTLPSRTASQHVYRWWDGEKFRGGFGATEVHLPDYWTLRQRSATLFRSNAYARGLMRRLITNEVNTGLELGAIPEENTLGVEQNSLEDWSSEIEERFHIWSRNPRLCDYQEKLRFGAMQAAARRAALISGDVLVVLRQDRRTRLPKVQLIDGAYVYTPMTKVADFPRVVHGVELDERGRHVAYHVLQRDGTSRRLPAYGARTGRRQAWLMYGTDRMLDDVRGQPFLALFLQMIREVDRYKDAALRKAVINSMLAMFIQKDEDKMGTLPISGGAIRRGTDITFDQQDTEERVFNVAELLPGMVIEELNPGETPQAFGAQGTDEKFGDFERSMLLVYAWANEIPPEILMLGFSNNYSASQAAINEFKIYLNRIRTDIGQDFCAPVYQDWLLAETLNGNVTANGLVDSWRQSQWDVWGAWTSSEWSGHIKPSTDILKQAKGYELLVSKGWLSHDRAARELTGTKFSKNIKKLMRENEALAEVNAILNPMPEENEDANLQLVDDENEQETG